jgi:hypothetical protein
VPNPTNVTIPPFFSALLTATTVPSSARPAAAFEMSADLAMASMSSDLFTHPPFNLEVKITSAKRRCQANAIKRERFVARCEFSTENRAQRARNFAAISA